MPDVIVTGLPRSGLTVASALIDSLPNAVCLNEPPWQLVQARSMRNALPYCKWLVGDFAWQRLQLARQEPVRDFRAADGAPLLDGVRDARRLETREGKARSVQFLRTPLEGDFILGMKHHTLYTALLPELVKFDHFNIIAVIRNPLDVIASWQSLPEPVIAKGNPPGILRFWPETVEAANEGVDRLAQLYELHLARYHALAEHIHIVKYEDMIDDPMIISKFFGVKKIPAIAKMIERKKPIRSASWADGVRKALRRYGVLTKVYYQEL